MTGFDILVLFVVGIAAIGGFARGFVQEALALGAWVVAVIAIRYLHTPLTLWVEPYIGSGSGAAVFTFLMILLFSYLFVKFVASKLGETSRNSLLGPVDRVLGFGFGAIKGSLVVVIGFSILVLGYDTVWGVAGRPAWIVEARSYQLVNAGSEGLVNLLSERQKYLEAGSATRSDQQS
ncbi:MAG: CvpA family protein [Sphingomonadaceae bacterium]